MRDVTCLIKTFERPGALRRLLKSLRVYYPDIGVIVADDSSRPYPEVPEEFGAMPLVLDHDTGLSGGRNAMVDACETPYFVLLDDDFEFSEHTRLELLYPWVTSGIFDLIGAATVQGGQLIHYEGWLAVEGDYLMCRHQRHDGSPLRCDIVLNFFLAKTSVVRYIRWDDELIMGEHLEFFLRCQEAKARVGYHPGVSIRHVVVSNPDYDSKRYSKATECRARWMEKRGFKGVSGGLSMGG